ncbi:MAG: hypothetical protein Q4G67_10955 [Actinomycetia bacterium]|nr:hypothetical protein [Actinomycetes bacterium]
MVGTAAAPAQAMEPVTAIDPIGDFEYSGTPVRDWATSAPSPNSIVASGTRAISGSRSMRIQDVSTTHGAVATRPKFTVLQGSQYHVQAYAFITNGTQTLALNFYDAAGKRIHRVSSNASPAAGSWSRISLRANTPAAAKSANIQISSSTTAVSEGWWDSISFLRPRTGNSSFEDGSVGTTIPAWFPNTSGGATVAVTREAARLGRQSAKITDTSTAGAATLRSNLIRVFPGVASDARFWMLLKEGKVTLTVRWQDANRREISRESFTTNIARNQWQLLVRTAVAPPNAYYASLMFSTRSSETGTAFVDGVTFAPSNGVLTAPYKLDDLGEPLDGFSNSQTSGMTTVGGRAKLYSVISGYPAHFQVIDVETGRLEADIPFPKETFNQGGAMTTGTDGTVYVGTQGGEFFRWRPGSDTVDDLGRATPTSTNVYDLQTGPDGRIWGGTYPGGELFSYTPGDSATVNHGQVAPGRNYARSIAVDDRYVYVGAGSTNPTLVRVDMNSPSTRTEITPPAQLTSGNISELSVFGRFLATNIPSGTTLSGATHRGQRYLYDLTSGTWDVPANVPGQRPVGMDSKGRFFYLAANHLNAVDSQTGDSTPLVRTDFPAGRNRMIYRGALGGVQGEWLISHTPETGLDAIEVNTYERRSFDLLFKPVSLRMKSLTPGPDGKIYAGGYGGASLAVIDPRSGAKSLYPTDRDAQNVIGEVEGMVQQGPYQFLGTYTRSKIFRYDTRQPWVDGSNPRLLVDLSGQSQDRPQAWTTSGERTFFGTVPAYGKLGGVLGVIDTPTSTPRVIPTPVANQSIVSLAAVGTTVYGGTSRWGGLGSTPSTPTAKVFAYDTATNRKLWEVTPPDPAQSFGAILVAPNGKIWAAAGSTLFEINRHNGELLRRIPLNTRPEAVTPTFRHVDLEWVNGLLYFATGDRVYTVDPKSLRVDAPVGSGVTHRVLAVIDGEVFYARGPVLGRISRG